MLVSRHLIAILLAASAVGVAGAAEPDCVNPSIRRVIKFYEYSGVQASNAAPMFAVFRKVVDEEVVRLNASSSSSVRPDLITTEPTPGSTLGYARGQLSPAASVDAMRADPRLLELLDGRIQPEPGTGTFVVHSNIYVPPLTDGDVTQPISEDFVLEPYQHDLARSIHLAAIYYALAVDAGRNGCRATQVSLLAKAEETLKDISPKGGDGTRALLALVHGAQRSLGMPR